MGRPPVPDTVVKALEALWGEDPKKSATQVYKEYRRKPGRQDISLRAVQKIVANTKARGGGSRFIPRPWLPWRNDAETPEDTSYLLRLDAAFMLRLRRHVYEHEAAWGRRLRVLLLGFTPEMQVLFVHEYGLREQVATNTQSYPAFTSDLDGLLTIKPWLREPEEAVEVYDGLVREGLIHPALLYEALDWPETEEMFQELERIVRPLIALLYQSDPWTWILERLGLKLDPPIRGDRVLGHYPYLAWMFDKLLVLLTGNKEMLEVRT